MGNSSNDSCFVVISLFVYVTLVSALGQVMQSCVIVYTLEFAVRLGSISGAFQSHLLHPEGPEKRPSKKTALCMHGTDEVRKK